jgi:hypothetical protein
MASIWNGILFSVYAMALRSNSIARGSDTYFKVFVCADQLGHDICPQSNLQKTVTEHLERGRTNPHPCSQNPIPTNTVANIAKTAKTANIRK